MAGEEKGRVAENHNDADIVRFSEKEGYNFGMIFVWLAALVAIISTTFMWINYRNVAKDLTAKSTEKDSIISEINSSAYKEVEDNVSGFRSSVSILTQAQKSRFTMSDFLPEFYKHLTKDVEINNLAINDKNQISFDGTTGSYRFAADLVTALSAWEPMQDVVLNTVSSSVDEAGKQKVAFAISATVDKTKSYKVVPVATGSTVLDTSTSSGDTAVSTSSADISSTTDTGVTAVPEGEL